MASRSRPKGLGRGGGALWRVLVTEGEVPDHELALVTQAARTVDRLNGLAEVIAAGGSGMHAAMKEERQQALTLTRLMNALSVPARGGTVSETARRIAALRWDRTG
ncbi:MAG: hypothetical protein GEU73_11130 [Chloroflexi bacterium]|nr:hypothetical protein [Chloroflexota bacterium]